MSVESTLILILVCMAGSFFFSGMETGIISIHRMRLRHFVRRGSKAARILQDILDNPDRLLGTTLVGNNICMVTISVLAAGLMVRWLGAWGEVVSTLVVSMLMLVFCEYLPKTWFHSRPMDRCQRYAELFRLVERLLWPLSRSVVWLTKWMMRGKAKPFSKPAPFVTREDLKILAREGERDGVLSPKERVMIHRVIELASKSARQIMIPRDRMCSVPAGTTLEGFLGIARQAGFTRFPVFDAAKDEFVGVANMFHVLTSRPTDLDRKVEEYARPPLFVPERLPADEVLVRMRRFRQPMGLVRNEANAVVGLVTTEDVLEQIVGKL